jgi:pimeloyl-ACP methyl ester carboxylesterase
MDVLAPNFHVFAPDSYDAGKSPQWPSDRVISLRDEVALIEPVLTRAGAPLAMVGHSYGAAVALIAALANPGRVRAMAIYEPTLFSLLDAEKPPPNETEGIRKAVASASISLDAGNQDAAVGVGIPSDFGRGRKITERNSPKVRHIIWPRQKPVVRTAILPWH